MLVSLLVVVFVALYALRGWRRGLVAEVVELVGLVAATVAAWAAWPALRDRLGGWPAALSGAAVFLVVLVGAGLTSRWARRHVTTLPRGGRWFDGVGGTVFAVTWSVLLVTGALTLLVTVPAARIRAADAVCDAPVARVLLDRTNPLHVGGERLAAIGRPVVLWLSHRLTDRGLTLSHAGDVCADLTEPPPAVPQATSVHPPAYGPFTFPAVEAADVAADGAAEVAILALLNRARVEAGLEPLVLDGPLRVLARAHSRDMYVRGYFAHETPECRTSEDAEGCADPFDRMHAAGIDFEVAGENLALAPGPDSAHRGLMDSPGHRANILNPAFRRVGVGVLRGPYGIMVSQEFAG